MDREQAEKNINPEISETAEGKAFERPLRNLAEEIGEKEGIKDILRRMWSTILTSYC